MRNIKDLNYKQLKELCAEIRDQIIRTVDKNGGHLASNLGVVELTVALCYVFDFDIDKIVFDVGHQVYAYKFLTDREDAFGSIRKEGGLSGFPDPEESRYDVFSTGHAGTSLAASLGLAYARDRRRDTYYVNEPVGDGSLING